MSDASFPKTGGPRSLAEIMPATRASMPRPSLRALSTTSPKGRDEPRSELVPAGSGGGVSGATPTPTESRGPLAVFDLPLQAATLQHSLAPLIVWGEVSVYGSHGYESTRITDVKVRPGADPQYVSQCLGQLENLCAPAGPKFAAQKLAELRALTAHRARGDVDAEVMATAYTARLAEYPADVVAAACDSWANANQFWPAWADLKDACDRKMKGRKQLRDALAAARRMGTA